jgi:hypothetical protein
MPGISREDVEASVHGMNVTCYALCGGAYEKRAWRAHVVDLDLASGPYEKERHRYRDQTVKI